MFHVPVNPSGFIGRSMAFIGHHSPLILICAAAGGVISSFIMAIRATTRADEILRKEREEAAKNSGFEPDEVEIEPREAFRAVWKLYVAPAVSLALSIGCMFLSLKITSSRYAALAGLYSSGQAAMQRYQEEVIRTFGQKEHDGVVNRVRKRRMDEVPIPEYMVPGEDSYLCFDNYSGRYWLGNLNTIRDAADVINRMVEHCMYISLNEFYEKIGLPANGNGNDVGWTAEEKMDLNWTTMIASNGHPCLQIDYNLAEHYDKRGYMNG